MENWLLIIVILIFAAGIIIGATRGFLKLSLSLLSSIFMVALMMFINPYVSNAISKYTPLEKQLEIKCKESLLEKTSEDPEQEQNLDALSLEEQIQYIQDTYLPSFIKERLIENNNSHIYEELGVTLFTDFAAAYMARMILKILSFLVSFILSIIVIRILFAMAGVIGMIPVLGGINRLAGIVAGFMIALVVVWILFLTLTVMNSTQIGRVGIQMINESQLLTFIYEKNILLQQLLKF